MCLGHLGSSEVIRGQKRRQKVKNGPNQYMGDYPMTDAFEPWWSSIFKTQKPKICEFFLLT